MGKFKTAGFWMLMLGNVLSIIGCFLPFAKVLFFSVPYIEGDGMIVLALNIIGIIITLIKSKIAFIANILALVVTAVSVVNMAELSLDLLSTGAYLIIIANIVAIIGSFKSKK